jgi:hypothetical protein
MTVLLAALDPDRVKPGWLGLVVVLAIAVGTILLWRSMNRQLRKIHFDEPSEDDDGADNGDASTHHGSPESG